MVGPLDYYTKLEPGVVYKWTMADGVPSFQRTNRKCKQHLKVTPTSELRKSNIGEHVVVKAQWLKAGNPQIRDNRALGAGAGNVFGETGRLIMPVDPLTIPVIDALDNLAYVRSFGLDLVKSGGVVCMPEQFHKPVLAVSYRFSKDYVRNFLSRQHRGAFLETHFFPQYFTPTTKSMKSYFMVGKFTDEDKDMLEITSFHIPYGYLLVSKEHAIHGDSYAIGKMMVTFDVTESEADVVYFRNDDYDIPRVLFGSPLVTHGIGVQEVTKTRSERALKKKRPSKK